jgi:hypothetical protein
VVVADVTSGKQAGKEECTKEHKYNLTQGLLKKSQPNRYIKKAKKYVGKKRSCRLSQTPPTKNTRNLLTCFW